ncbi:hypothetical protein CVT26_008705 [Gymnopilus dilepis]|uniref:DUF6532 domain-containing protein n=1 Tax=Gymnopilus dilepis TaxID=231916 RepID=A0A409YSB2_9AGAR|nr:hypothetical protein CVT26_008705 [Gymnopilus dilepis]
MRYFGSLSVLVGQSTVALTVIDRMKIYQNLGFMDSLKDTFFESRKDFGFKYIDEFKSSIEKRPEPELTIPIVALAATRYFAAIQAWESGRSHEKAEKFEGELFNATFEHHVSYLESVKETNLVAFHVIMSRLYNHATYIILSSTYYHLAYCNSLS